MIEIYPNPGPDYFIGAVILAASELYGKRDHITPKIIDATCQLLERCEFTVGVDNGEVIGFGAYEVVPDTRTARLSAFATAPGARRIGLGSLVLGHIESGLATSGVERVKLDALPQYERFYVQNGYRNVGEPYKFEKVLSSRACQTPTKIQAYSASAMK
jgi:ribosomal protein S18 acetylase RimI-like enzyme